MGAALGLLIGGPEHLYTVVFGIVLLCSLYQLRQLRPPCSNGQRRPLFTYVGVVFTHTCLGSALYCTFVPQFVFDAPHAMALVAVLGTTISPYLFFWQAGQEVEELHRRHVSRCA